MSEHNIDPEIPFLVGTLAAGAHHHLFRRVLDDRVGRVSPQLAYRDRVVVAGRAVVHDDLRRPVVYIKRVPLMDVDYVDCLSVVTFVAPFARRRRS